MFDFKQTCITIGRGDYYDEAIAINSQYLAVSNTEENKVIIYTLSRFSKWRKIKEILAPKNSTPYKYREGFGTKLYLEKDILGIEATIIKNVDSVVDSDDFTLIDKQTAVFSGVYLINLASETEAKVVETKVLNLSKENENTSSYQLLFQQKFRKIIIDRNDQYRFSVAAKYKNLFLVGRASRYRGGKALLYDLNVPRSPPEVILAPDFYIGTTVAVSSHFVAMGEIGTLNPPPQDAPFLKSKTLVRAIKNGSTSIIDSYGKVSLSNNILAVMRCSAQGHRVALLEVFRLDRNAVPHLIIKRKNVRRALVQNGFLITIEKRGKLKMYIKPIS